MAREASEYLILKFSALEFNRAWQMVSADNQAGVVQYLAVACPRIPTVSVRLGDEVSRYAFDPGSKVLVVRDVLHTPAPREASG